jgi:hypothetical protein
MRIGSGTESPGDALDSYAAVVMVVFGSEMLRRRSGEQRFLNVLGVDGRKGRR